MKKIALTVGDPDGVGPEVTVKALLARGPQRNERFYVFRDAKFSSRLFRSLEGTFHRVICASLTEALDAGEVSSRTIFEIVDEGSAPDWVETAARACLRGELDGLVTGPLSKTLIQATGRREVGHTEILQRLAKVPRVYQGYLGSRFCVVLVTAHVPVSGISKSLTTERVREALDEAFRLRSCLVGAKAKKPLALLGLNPHAGEEGILGTEETRLREAVRGMGRRKSEIVGPLVPDAAFVESNWSRYAVYVACYHDQGLIPFKMIHGKGEGAQISLGLPFVRTSVDHGTAKDIAGRNKADPGSMSDAIRWCLQLA